MIDRNQQALAVWSSFASSKPVINWKWSGNQTNPPDVRGWESQGTGLTFDLEGPDSHSITMQPAPRLDSQELIATLGVRLASNTHVVVIH